MTILTEFLDQVEASSPPPTHVFLQAGVGSFSGADTSVISRVVERKWRSFETGIKHF